MKKFVILLFIFVITFSVRLSYIASEQDTIEQDEIQYDSLATRILETHTYTAQDGKPTALRPPFYPFFLALIYKIFGHSYLIARLIQAILSALTVCVFYLIAEKIFNKTTALLTGILASFYMTFNFYAESLLSETLFSFLLAVIVYLVVTAKSSELLKHCILGLLCGALTLVRSSGFFVPLVICFGLLISNLEKRESLKKYIKPVFLLIACFLFMLLPWTMRNYNIYKRIIPVSTNGGQNIYQAVKPAYGKIPEMGPREDPIAEIGFSIPNEADRSDYFMKEAIKAYKENPKKAIRSFIIRFLFFWNIIDWNVTDGDIINYHFLFILPFALLGIIYSLRFRKESLFVLLVILYFSSLVILFQGAARFRMPIDGYIIIFGSYGVYEFVNRKKIKAIPILITASYFLLTFLLYENSLAVKYFIRNLMESIGIW